MNQPAPSPSSAPATSARPASRARAGWSHALDALLLGLCALLVALSYYSATLYCESFGCMGRGLMWMLWSVLASVGWVVAWGVRAWQQRSGLGARVSGFALMLVSVMGAGHLLYWLSHMTFR